MAALNQTTRSPPLHKLKRPLVFSTPSSKLSTYGTTKPCTPNSSSKPFSLPSTSRNNLLNMYAKCGHLPDALQLFDEMTHEKVVSWIAVITGFFQKGHPVEALSVQTHAREWNQAQRVLLRQRAPRLLLLEKSCTRIPDLRIDTSVWFSVEYLLDEAKKYFSSMTDIYGMHPGEDQYACMVNLLGRQGRTKEAEELILEMPFQPGFYKFIDRFRLYGGRLFGVKKGESYP
ncbi:hypothetical protein RJ640_027607 [Escallonia rubra]|uniref:Pentatricopeptide repeat-containing protein n=1 Tax=Escallonia rubra TaxID=112253 RepID=A0AA88QT10_9ASTE|nr:hypothetical protein RJ640_027607 [Escallonia rubra]